MTTALQVLAEGGQEIAAYTPPDPQAIVASATAQANVLADIIEKRKLYSTIQGRKHVLVEGWQTLGALNNLQAFTESMRTGVDDQGNVWAASMVSARRMNDGASIAQAEGFCSTKEACWRGRDEYAVRSMAQTRATSKVFRQALAWVMVLAGYDTTPAEEMPSDDSRPRARTKPADEPPPQGQAFGSASRTAKLWLSTELAAIGQKPTSRAELAGLLGMEDVPDDMTLGDLLETVRLHHAGPKPLEGDLL